MGQCQINWKRRTGGSCTVLLIPGISIRMLTALYYSNLRLRLSNLEHRQLALQLPDALEALHRHANLISAGVAWVVAYFNRRGGVYLLVLSLPFPYFCLSSSLPFLAILLFTFVIFSNTDMLTRHSYRPRRVPHVCGGRRAPRWTLRMARRFPDGVSESEG
jgi:hypothetical protein